MTSIYLEEKNKKKTSYLINSLNLSDSVVNRKTTLCLIYVICVCFRLVVSNTYCVVVFWFFFWFFLSSSCVLCCQFIWIVHSVFSNVRLFKYCFFVLLFVKYIPYRRVMILCLRRSQFRSLNKYVVYIIRIWTFKKEMIVMKII